MSGRWSVRHAVAWPGKWVAEGPADFAVFATWAAAMAYADRMARAQR